MKTVKGLSEKKRKKKKKKTHRHRQQCGDYQRARGMGGGRRGQREDKL